jgi:hypothetical protein
VYGWIALNYMTGHLASNPILAADQGLEGTADEPIAVTSAPSLTLAVSWISLAQTFTLTRHQSAVAVMLT